MKDILVFDHKGRVIYDCSSMKEASEKTNVPTHAIKRCIETGKESDNGYTFDEALEARA